MFIEDNRIEEISREITEKGIGILQKIDSEEVQAYLNAVLENNHQNERDMAIFEAYKSGALTQEDDPYILW